MWHKQLTSDLLTSKALDRDVLGEGEASMKLLVGSHFWGTKLFSFFWLRGGRFGASQNSRSGDFWLCAPGMRRNLCSLHLGAIATLLGFLSLSFAPVVPPFWAQRLAHSPFLLRGWECSPVPGNIPKPLSFSYLIYTMGQIQPTSRSCGFDNCGSYSH